MQDIIEEFYGLQSAPFRLTPDPRFFVGTSVHRKALNYLNFGLEQGEGFIVITGEIGAGKSLVIEHMLAQLDQSRIVARTLVTSAVEADEALKLIVSAFDIDVEERQKAAALESFSTFLRRQHSAGRRVLLIVDEAQNLPKKTIEELRMLTNLQVEGRSVFQIFLVGQPQFRDILMDPDLEQLRQRVVASFHMEPLSFDDTQQYIEHRLNLVGWTGRPSISAKAVRAIHDASSGLPRRINVICSRLLLFGALEEKDELDDAAVAEVLEDLRNELTSDPADARARHVAAHGEAARGAARDKAMSDPAEGRQKLDSIERRLEQVLQRYFDGSRGGAISEAVLQRLGALEETLADFDHRKSAFVERRDLNGLRNQVKELKKSLAALDERVDANEVALRRVLQLLINFVGEEAVPERDQEMANGRSADTLDPNARPERG